MTGKIHAALDRIGNLPGVLPWRQRRFDQSFEAGQSIGCCRGVFETQAQAAAAAPTSRPLGYDHADAADMYRDRLSRIFPSDYPMMLWLQKVFDDGARKVFDLGGHIGLAYYAYQKLVDFPRDTSWCVNDVPAVMASGEREALALDPLRRLTFSDRFEAAADADVLFTAGCLQYLDQTLAERLAALPRRPRWLLVNLLPLHERSAYWTVQSIGTAYCPYRIQHAQAFFAELEALGYRIQDQWENIDKACWIAFEPEHSLDRYHGAALRLDPAQ
jgi:putative methyltransferase (TIGR04325 family)